MGAVALVDLASEGGPPPGVVEAAVRVEGHPVGDLGLILGLSVFLHDTLERGIFFHKHDAEDSGRCLVAGRGVAGDHVALKDHLSVYIAPHVLGGQVHLHIGGPDPVVLLLLVVGGDVVGGLAGLLLSGLEILQEQVVLDDLVDHIAVVAAGHGDRAPRRGLEFPVHAQCIGIDGQVLEEFPELLVPDLVVLDQPALFVADQPVLGDVRVQADLALVRKDIGNAGGDQVVEVLAAGDQARVLCLELRLLVGSGDLLGVDLLLIAGCRVSHAGGQLDHVDRVPGVLRDDLKHAVLLIIAVAEADIGIFRGLHVGFLQLRQGLQGLGQLVRIIAAAHLHGIGVFFKKVEGPAQDVLPVQHGADGAVRLVAEADIISLEYLGCPAAETNIEDIVFGRGVKEILRLVLGQAAAVVAVDRRPGQEMGLPVFVSGCVDASDHQKEEQQGDPEGLPAPAGFLFALFPLAAGRISGILSGRGRKCLLPG